MKRNKTHFFNLTHEDCLKEIKEVFELNKLYYKNVEIRCVSVINEGKWFNGISVFRIYPKNVEIMQTQNLYYDNIHFLSQVIKPDEIFPFLDQLKTNEIEVAGEKVIMGPKPEFSEMYIMHTYNNYSSHAGYLFMTRSPNLCNIPSDFPLTYNLPYFPSVFLAIKDWIGLPDFHDERDGRLHTLILFLPEIRAYFNEIKYDNKKEVLFIKVKRNDMSLKLLLKGYYLCNEGYVLLDKPFKSSPIAQEIPAEHADIIEEINLYLIDDKDNIFDRHRENRYVIEGKHRIFGVSTETQWSEFIRKAISTGEGEQIEFKTYIRRGDRNIKKLIETIIAFANCKGGYIFIGINDYTVPVGIEKGIEIEASKHNKSYESMLQEYIGNIRKEISDNLNRLPSIDISSQQFAGHSLLIISVSAGKQRPYFNLKTKDSFIRRGANNVKPIPNIEWAKLLSLDEVE